MHDYTENPAVKFARYAAFLIVLLCAALGVGLLLDPASIHAQFSEPAASTHLPTGPLDAPVVAATGTAPATDFLAGLFTLAVAAYFFMRLLRWQAELNARAAVRPFLERLSEFAAGIELATDTTALAAIRRDIAAAQQDVERQWIAGRLHTAHLQLLNQLYETHARSASDKSQQLLLQALIEGGPVPATYHPAPAAPRPVQAAPPVYTPAPVPAVTSATPIAALQETRDNTDAPLASTQHRPEAAQPVVPSGIGQPRVRHKKDRGHRHHQHHETSQAPAAPAPAPVVPAAPVSPAAPAPRQLSEWEVEQKYQRTSDVITDFDSGIISPPRPRRKQGNLDAAAPAESRIEEESGNGDAPQLDLFGKGR